MTNYYSDRRMSCDGQRPTDDVGLFITQTPASVYSAMRVKSSNSITSIRCIFVVQLAMLWTCCGFVEMLWICCGLVHLLCNSKSTANRSESKWIWFAI